jgi:hypothetical protein
LIFFQKIGILLIEFGKNLPGGSIFRKIQCYWLFHSAAAKLKHKGKLMKNKILILALLVVFVSVSFIACGGDSPKKVKEITVIPVGSEGWILSWEVKGKNITDCQVVGKMEDKATIEILTHGDNRSILTATGGSPNSNPDVWYAFVDKEDYYYISGDYYFGVRTISAAGEYSNIRWTDSKYSLVKSR